jgi:uncharacterized protein YbaR (Trm112 family)
VILVECIAAKRLERKRWFNPPIRGEAGMLRSDVLAILRCPEDRSELTAASEAIVNQVNAAIREGRLVNRARKRVERVIDAGLIRADGAWLYPIIDQIPILLRDDAISLDQLGR